MNEKPWRKPTCLLVIKKSQYEAATWCMIPTLINYGDGEKIGACQGLQGGEEGTGRAEFSEQ